MRQANCIWRCAAGFGEAVAAANGLPDDPQALAATGMFSAPVATGDETNTQAKLLARLGRNPRWTPASS